MEPMYCIGLDVHSRMISYCVKDGSGQIHSEGKIPATRYELARWMKILPRPWSGLIGNLGIETDMPATRARLCLPQT